ncbi:3-deoxy-D-manno-octulosonic acid transferase [Xanthobacter pseudotagetidis]|uniref:3-deoxy-D-manno-octulosonic acid transferase n=1 Tax=Xanthobacter pseudotagetidis TaxID=3119911 RepID=UPI0037270DC6
MKARALTVTLRLYRGASAAAALLTPAWLSYRAGKGKEDRERLPERRGIASAERPEGPLIWVHGASVGEVNCVMPLIERLVARRFNVLLTSGTLTSSKVAARRAPEGVIHQFMPLDAGAFVSRFLDHWQPDLVLLAESELWPNLLYDLGRRATPVVLVNGRLSPKSAQRWARLSRSARALLSRVDLCLAQSEEDGARFRALGAPRVEVCGNLKLDVPAPAADPQALAALSAAIGARPVLLAASTHAGEEVLAMATHKALRKELRELLTIIAPRHPERGEEIAELAEEAGLRTARRSAGAVPTADTDIYVADTMGEMGLLYRCAPVVFMGGSLVEHGGQNPIEAAKLGAVVLHGPHVWNFAAIYARFDADGGALPVADVKDLARLSFVMLRDKARRERAAAVAQVSVAALGGALERTLAAIEPYLVHIRLQHR